MQWRTPLIGPVSFRLVIVVFSGCRVAISLLSHYSLTSGTFSPRSTSTFTIDYFERLRCVHTAVLFLLSIMNDSRKWHSFLARFVPFFWCSSAGHAIAPPAMIMFVLFSLQGEGPSPPLSTRRGDTIINGPHCSTL